MNPLLEIMNEWNKLNSKQLEEFTEPEYIDLIPLRRTHKTTCKSCERIYSVFIPENIPSHSMLCDICSYKIWNKNEQFTQDIIGKIQQNEKIKKVHEEILEIGMHPDRVRQTQLYLSKWNT